MRRLVPRIHRVERRVVLVNDEHRRLRDGFERVVGDDERHLDDPIGIGLQAGHFEVDPDQPVGVLWHGGEA